MRQLFDEKVTASVRFRLFRQPQKYACAEKKEIKSQDLKSSGLQAW